MSDLLEYPDYYILFFIAGRLTIEYNNVNIGEFA